MSKRSIMKNVILLFMFHVSFASFLGFSGDINYEVITKSGPLELRELTNNQMLYIETKLESSKFHFIDIREKHFKLIKQYFMGENQQNKMINATLPIIHIIKNNSILTSLPQRTGLVPTNENFKIISIEGLIGSNKVLCLKFHGSTTLWEHYNRLLNHAHKNMQSSIWHLKDIETDNDISVIAEYNLNWFSHFKHNECWVPLYEG